MTVGKVASDFSTSVNYAVGDLTMYNGVLFEFITTHNAGAWNASHVQSYDSLVPEQISRIISGVDVAEQAVEFADRVVFEPTQLSGTRYKYTLLNP